MKLQFKLFDNNKDTDYRMIQIVMTEINFIAIGTCLPKNSKKQYN